jgi:hypothetical protein
MRLAALSLALVVTAAPAAAQSPRLEVWAGGGLGAGKRNAAWSGSVGAATGSGPYLQAGLRYRFVAVQARYLAADFSGDSALAGAGKVTSRELYASVGPAIAGLDLGYGQRSYRGTLAQRVWSYFTVGGHLDVPIGSSGFWAGATLHLYVGGKESSGGATASGRFGETTLSFRLRSAPLYFLLGYRVEQFTVSGTPSSPEELTAVILGGGLHL